MTKCNIKITGYEDSEDGSRTRFNTANNGWVSAFKNEGETLIPDLKSHTERLISVDLTQSKKLKQNGQPYLNIRKFFGVADATNAELDEANESTQDLVDVAEVIKAKTIVVKPENFEKSVENEYNPTSMYVSYAKDIFIRLLDSSNMQNLDVKQIMVIAINMVKDAHNAFK